MISMLSLLLYCWNWRQTPISQWNSESKLAFAVQVSLLLFNDPFFLLSLMFPSVFSSVVSMLTVTQFWLILYICWTIPIINRTGKSLRGTLNSLNMGFALLCYLTGMALYTYSIYELDNDSTWVNTFDEHKDLFVFLRITF